MKVGKDVPWVKLYKDCSNNLILSITVVAMATKRKKFAKSVPNKFVLWSENVDVSDVVQMGVDRILYF